MKSESGDIDATLSKELSHQALLVGEADSFVSTDAGLNATMTSFPEAVSRNALEDIAHG